MAIIDIEKKKNINLDYEANELAELMPEFGLIEEKAAEDDTDFKWFENGKIYAEVAFGYPETLDGPQISYVGSIQGKLVYDSETESFVLDPDSVEVKWYDENE